MVMNKLMKYVYSYHLFPFPHSAGSIPILQNLDTILGNWKLILFENIFSNIITVFMFIYTLFWGYF